MFRRWGLKAPTVERSDFLTQEEAARVLSARAGTLSVGAMIARRILEPAFLPDGTEGVSRSSVEEEVEWRRTASFVRRLSRRIGGILHWL